MSKEANDEALTETVPAVALPPERVVQRVLVPAWVMGLVVLLAVGALGFGLARWTDSGPGDRGRPPAGAIGQGPGGNQGNQGGNQGNQGNQNGPGNQGNQGGPSNQGGPPNQGGPGNQSNSGSQGNQNAPR